MKRKNRFSALPAFWPAAALLLLLPPGASGGQKINPVPGATPFFSLRIHRGLVTLRARGVDRGEAVRRLAESAGLKLNLYEEPGGKISVDFHDLSLEDALKKLLPDYGFVYRPDSSGVLVLREVSVFRTRPSSPGAAYSHIRTLSYGSGPGEAGLLDLPEMEREGPQSFSVNGKGEICLADTVNRRLEVFSPRGKLELEIKNAGRVSSLALSEGGDIFALDEARGLLLHYDRAGILRGEVKVPAGLMEEKEAIRFRRGEVLLRDREGGEWPLARMDKGGMIPSPEKRPAGKGRSGRKGRVISVVKENAREAVITVRESGGKLNRKIALPLARLASVVLLGEDHKGRLLPQVERFHPDRPGVDLEVLKVDLSGKILAGTGKIRNNYLNWTDRLLQSDSRGDLYQMLPGPKGVELNRWRWKE